MNKKELEEKNFAYDGIHGRRRITDNLVESARHLAGTTAGYLKAAPLSQQSHTVGEERLWTAEELQVVCAGSLTSVQNRPA